MRNILNAVLLSFLSSWVLVAQDNVLFTMDGIPVTVDEFERTYNKNSDIPGANIPVDEYLERYINFRLKVLEAEHMGYDTMRTFLDELEGYRAQLAGPYMQDAQTIDRLVREAYDRILHEVNVSQILVLLPENPGPEDTLRNYQKTIAIRNRLLQGEPFEKVATETSEDPSVNSNKGNVGWFSAFTMVFPFEEAAYKTPVDSISMPVRTSYGYHIIRVNGIREALGEVRLAHIMVRAGINEGEAVNEEALKKINMCYELIASGEDFGDVARQYSEDASTAGDNGLMRWIRSGELPPDIEEVVFAMEDSGSFTRPLRSVYGWHIFQLRDKRPIGSFKELEPQLREKVLSDERIVMAEKAFLNAMKKQSGFIEYASNIAYLVGTMDSTVYSGKWKPDAAGSLIEPVFALGGKDYLQIDLAQAVAEGGQHSRNLSLQEIVRQTCDDMVRKELMQFRKNRLEDDFPEFRDLMQEYHDGILLFNISNDRVWQRAVQDTTGLKSFYEQHQSDYLMPEQAVVIAFALEDGTLLDRVKKYAKKGVKKNLSASEILYSICGNDSSSSVQVSEESFEKGENRFIDGMKWKRGALEVVQQDTACQLYIIRRLIQQAPMSLSASRGIVMADYQDYLEAQWVKELRDKYPVLIRPDALKMLQELTN